MFEPGFMGARMPLLNRILGTLDFSKLFYALGMLPIENELHARTISAIALFVQRRHGDLPLHDVFREDVLALFGSRTAGKTLAWLSSPEAYDIARKKQASMNAVAQPYRREILDETRASITADLARIERVIASGATFYLTPEGRYSRDGSLGRLRVALGRLARRAQVYMVATSYDVFVGRRLSQLFRIVPPANPSDLSASLKAARPITTSCLLCGWLKQQTGAFDSNDARRAVVAGLKSLPAGAFVDPDLRRNPERMVRAALGRMVSLGTLSRRSGAFALTAHRTHPQFPLVADMVSYQALFFRETVEALELLQKGGS